jgi:hypothetical protein
MQFPASGPSTRTPGSAPPNRLYLRSGMSIPRISCTLLRPSSTCAAFIKESRMKFINATELPRKSGIREQSFVTVIAVPVLFSLHYFLLPKF